MSTPENRLPLTAIRLDGDTQTRAAMNADVVREYADAMVAGTRLPPVVVFFDGTDHWLADGFHRYRAAEVAGQSEIAAEVRRGTLRDALLHSVGANAGHGLRRTNADKRRAVLRLLADAEWSKRSNRWIAGQCAVSPAFVDGVRSELTANGWQLPASTVGRDGRVRQRAGGELGEGFRRACAVLEAANAAPPSQWAEVILRELRGLEDAMDKIRPDSGDHAAVVEAVHTLLVIRDEAAVLAGFCRTSGEALGELVKKHTAPRPSNRDHVGSDLSVVPGTEAGPVAEVPVPSGEPRPGPDRQGEPW